MHLFSRWSGKFYYIMYGIDKTMLLLIIATWQFDNIKVVIIAFNTVHTL